jgi:hypothetical protein
MILMVLHTNVFEILVGDLHLLPKLQEQYL